MNSMNAGRSSWIKSKEKGDVTTVRDKAQPISIRTIKKRMAAASFLVQVSAKLAHSVSFFCLFFGGAVIVVEGADAFEEYLQQSRQSLSRGIEGRREGSLLI